MRVLLDTSAALRGPGGTAVYVRQLAAALRTAGVDVVEAADVRRGPPGGGGLASLRNAAHDLRWREQLAAAARRARADVLHHPLPAHAWTAPCPQVVTVHDLGFRQAPAMFARSYRSWARVEHRMAASMSAAVICVSETTRSAVLAGWGLSPGRVAVARHGPGQWDGPPAPAATRPEGPGWFLYVGDAEPRKNLGLLIEGYALYRRLAAGREGGPLGLVVAGAAGGGTRAAEARAGAGPSAGVSAGAGVRFESRPGTARLRELYAGAAALVHPAVLEGFGLTPLEAMHLGTPVLAQPAPAVVEVCGDAALYMTGPDAGALAAQLARLADEPGLRAELSAAGLRRAAVFSWETSARAHIEAYTLAQSVSARTATGVTA